MPPQNQNVISKAAMGIIIPYTLIALRIQTELLFCLHPSPFARNADKQRGCKGEAFSLKLHLLSSSSTKIFDLYGYIRKDSFSQVTQQCGRT